MKWKWRGAGGPLASAPTLSWHRDDEHPGFIPSDNRGRGGGGKRTNTPRREAEMEKKIKRDESERKKERETETLRRPKTAASLPPSSFIRASLSSCPGLFIFLSPFLM